MKGPKQHRGVSLPMWTDEKFVALSPLARLLWIGSWHYCCDEGHLMATPLELKMRVLPADNCDIDTLFAEVLAQGLYVGDPQAGYMVPNLKEHQKVDKRWLLACDRCPQGAGPASTTSAPREDHASTTSEAREDSRGTRAEEKRREEKGRTTGARQRGTRLPDIYPISDEMRAWVREHAPDVSPQEHEKFCDYWRGVAGQRGVKLDWFATWRNWMRKAQEDATPHRPASAHPDVPDWMLA